jgi:hypothetical protein
MQRVEIGDAPEMTAPPPLFLNSCAIVNFALAIFSSKVQNSTITGQGL